LNCAEITKLNPHAASSVYPSLQAKCHPPESLLALLPVAARFSKKVPEFLLIVQTFLVQYLFASVAL